jgi:hypothetical protein
LYNKEFGIISVVTISLFPASPTLLGTVGDDDCFNVGYRDGRDHPFDHEKYEECKAAASSYYHGFINGCMSVERNTREICESATD